VSSAIFCFLLHFWLKSRALFCSDLQKSGEMLAWYPLGCCGSLFVMQSLDQLLTYYLNPEPELSTELPGNVTAAHDADDLPADLFFDDGPPRQKAEAEPVIDHGKTPADELG
jgi:hypothetical protein